MLVWNLIEAVHQLKLLVLHAILTAPMASMSSEPTQLGWDLRYLSVNVSVDTKIEADIRKVKISSLLHLCLRERHQVTLHLRLFHQYGPSDVKNDGVEGDDLDQDRAESTE